MFISYKFIIIFVELEKYYGIIDMNLEVIYEKI